jgi:DNA-directed RNA polymerase subunit E"
MTTKKKVCKKCKVFVEGNACPECGGTQFTDTWKGKVHVIDPANSEIAKKLKLSKPGVYAIKSR